MPDVDPLPSNEPTATFVVLPVRESDGVYRLTENGEYRLTEDGQIVELD